MGIAQNPSGVGGLGYGSTSSFSSGQRPFNTTFYNTKNRPIFVSVTADVGANANFFLTCDGITQESQPASGYGLGGYHSVCGIVSVGGSYIAQGNGGTVTLRTWGEK